MRGRGRCVRTDDLTQPMRFALVETDTLVFVGFHAAVFVAVVVVLLAVQWLFEKRR